MKGIICFSLASIRQEPSHRSEMINQLQFSDFVNIYEIKNEWSYIESIKDQYKGWCLSEQIKPLSDDNYLILSKYQLRFTNEYCCLLKNTKVNHNLLLPFGTPVLVNPIGNIDIHSEQYENVCYYSYSDNITESIIQTASKYLNTPYLWGGKSIFGIDCSGFTQQIFQMHGYQLKRDASQQITQGTIISNICESRAGDLAFFENENGKITHVGIMINNHSIIHASIYVRISKIDEYGILHDSGKTYTHRLNSFRRYIL